MITASKAEIILKRINLPDEKVDILSEWAKINDISKDIDYMHCHMHYLINIIIY